MNIGIFIYDDIEVLDLGGPFEIFSVAMFIDGILVTDLPQVYHGQAS